MSNIGIPPCDIGVIRSRRADAPCEETSRPWVLAATIIGSAMAFIDSTVTNVALPQIQERLGATATDAQWIVASYALFLSALILVGGPLGDHFGRRRIFSLGVIVFTLASVWCGLSTSPEMLIVARAVQGVGGAMLVPGSLAIISASFDGDERGKAIGTWSGMPYEEKATVLLPGDRVLFYSDGLIESHNQQREMLGSHRLRDLLTEQAPDAEHLTAYVVAELGRFTGEQWEQEDDITLVTLQRRTARDQA